MPARFSQDQPWNFGYTPCDYWDTLSAWQQYRLNVNTRTIGTAEQLFAKTLQVPGFRKLPKNIFASMLEPAQQRKAILTASHCKPVAEIRVKHDSEENFLSILKELGMRCLLIQHPSYTKFIISAEQSLPHHYSLIYHHQDQYGWIKPQDLRFLAGILHGYPMADIFGIVQPKPLLKPRGYNAEGLDHMVYPDIWSSSWKQEIGDRANMHLRSVYSLALTEKTEQAPAQGQRAL
jgi:hypothetical protein